MTQQIRVIVHLDDVACCHGANVAFEELAESGAISSASVMVPTGWFPEAAEMAAAMPEFDTGIHLVLTSERASFRWRPLSTLSQASGLLDPDGYFWPRSDPVRSRAHPDAVEQELRTQIDRAKAAGVDVSHLDHHMGVALAPEFVERTAAIAVDYGLPVLLPHEFAAYAADVDVDDPDDSLASDVKSRLGTMAVGDRFVMGLTYKEGDSDEAFDGIVDRLQPGVTFLSLHCAASGDVEAVHSNDGSWRVAEYELLRSGSLAQRLRASGAEVISMPQAAAG